MNIFLLPVGSHGDVHPFVGVGRALRERGHTITLIANEIYEPLARAQNFQFVECGSADDFQMMTRDPDLWHPSRSMRAVFNQDLMRKFLPTTYHAIEKLNRPGETIMIAGTLGFAPRIAREKLGIPLVSVHLQPISLGSVEDPPKYPSRMQMTYFPRWLRRASYWYAERVIMDGFLAGPINDFRKELGLPAIRRIWGPWRQSPDLVLGLFPKWFATAPDWPANMRQTGFVRYDQSENAPLSEELETFLRAGEPPVVISFGSAMRQGRPYFEAAVEACRRLNLRSIILAKDGEQIPTELPAGCMQWDYAPFSQIFPRAAAVIHHGGIGTTAQCLAAGVPQLVMPMAFDQPDNADRVVKLGVARSVLAARFSADRAAQSLNELLHDETTRSRCEAIQKKLDDEPLPETCTLIESVLRK